MVSHQYCKLFGNSIINSVMHQYVNVLVDMRVYFSANVGLFFRKTKGFGKKVIKTEKMWLFLRFFL